MIKRNRQIDALRAFAALLVAAAHFGTAAESRLHFRTNPLGLYGVFVFFVISGYIIPKVLHSGGYSVKDFPRFLAKRLIRLYPPFLAALGITLVLSALAAFAKHQPIAWTSLDVVSYLSYISSPAENPVFWTLQVEMCFYIALGLCLPLLNADSFVCRMISFGASALVCIWGAPHLLFFRYLGFFLIGLALEGYEDKVASTRETLMKLLLAAVLAAYQATLVSSAFGIFTCFLIAFGGEIKWPKAVLLFGLTSYSFYLLHFPLGIKFLNLAIARMPEVPIAVCLICAFLMSWIAAIFLFFTIESRCIKASKWRRSATD